MVSNILQFFRRRNEPVARFSTGIYRSCPRCKKDFWITSIETAFYNQLAVSLPHHCRMCIREVEAERAQQQAPIILDRAANS